MFPERTEFPPRLCRGWEAAGCSSACCASGHCRSRWHWHRRALSLFLPFSSTASSPGQPWLCSPLPVACEG